MHYREDFLRADVVVFHIPTTPLPLRLPRRPGQAWVAWSMESDVNYPQQRDPGFMTQFDLTATYRSDADVTLSYAHPHEWLDFRPAARDPAARFDPAPAAFIASSPFDRSGRIEYVRELMRHIEIASYGRVLNNRRLSDDRGPETKLATLARHRFTLAFENSVAVDYVTEKLFESLLAGSVPVYLGAPNVAEHAPAPGCYLDVSSFSGPAELAAHLRVLVDDDAAYGRLHEWRERPLEPAFLQRLSEQRAGLLVRIDQALRARRHADAGSV